MHWITATYSYELNGKKHFADNLDLSGKNIRLYADELLEAQRKYAVGSLHSGYADPSRPEHATLNRGFTYGILIPGLLLAMLCSLPLIVYLTQRPLSKAKSGAV